VLMFSTLLNVAYLMPISIRGFLYTQKTPPGERTAIKEAPMPSVIALCLTASGCIALFFFAQPLYQLMSDLFEH